MICQKLWQISVRVGITRSKVFFRHFLAHGYESHESRFLCTCVTQRDMEIDSTVQNKSGSVYFRYNIIHYIHYIYMYICIVIFGMCLKKQARFECFDANLVTGFAKAPGLGASQALRFDVPWRGNAMGCPWWGLWNHNLWFHKSPLVLLGPPWSSLFAVGCWHCYHSWFVDVVDWSLIGRWLFLLVLLFATVCYCLLLFVTVCYCYLLLFVPHICGVLVFGCALPAVVRPVRRLPSPSVAFRLTHTHNSLTHNGTWRHRTSLCVAGVALMALGWLWWRAWFSLAPRLFMWQVWHLEAPTRILCGRPGTWRHRLFVWQV